MFKSKDFRFWLAIAAIFTLFGLVFFGECEAPAIIKEQAKIGALPFTGIVIGFTIIFFSVVAISVISHYEKEVKEKYNL